MRISRVLHLANKLPSKIQCQIGKNIKIQPILTKQTIFDSHHFSFFNKRVSYRFCNNKNQQNKNEKQKTQNLKDSHHNSKKGEDFFSNQQEAKNQKIIQKDQQQFNAFIGLPKQHSFKKDLIVAQQTYKKQIKQLKQAILFEDLLRKQINILIYDTQGKPYFSNFVRGVLIMISVFGLYITLYKAISSNDKAKLMLEKTIQGRIMIIIMQLICAFLIFRVISRHLGMSKRFVEKIVYNTQTESFTFTKRRLWGTRFNEEVSRYKILYTENQNLNKRGTNYLNIDNQNQYQIGYKFAWKKEDLFSHLISQRIRT